MRAIKKQVHVLFLPDYSKYNPYQKELVKALAKYGVTVEGITHTERFPLLRVIWIRLFEKLDVLHLHWTSPFLISQRRGLSLLKATIFMLAIICFKLLGIKLVWTVHDLIQHDSPQPNFERRCHRLLSYLYDEMIVHCELAKASVLHHYQLPTHLEHKMSVVPHGHFLATYENSLTQEHAREQLALSNQAFVFLYFGQIRPYKGVFDLIRAFQTFDDPRARLLIVGKPANESLKAQIEADCLPDKRIALYLKFVPDDDIQLYMKAADVVVLPFKKILTSSTVLLAMSYGKVIIAPRMGCVGEQLDHQGALLYELQEENGLRNAMHGATQYDFAEMGRRNYEQAKQLDWDKSATGTLAAYKQALS